MLRSRSIFAALVWVVTALTLTLPQIRGNDATFRRGDSNGDSTVDISDSIFLLGFLFLGNPTTIPCEDAADSNGDAKLDLSDAVNGLWFLFQGGPPPPPPGPVDCGPATEPFRGCAEYTTCDNSAPRFTSGPSANPDSIDESQATSLSAIAADADGDALSFTWSQASPASPSGSFSDANALNTTWTAPAVNGDTDFTLHLKVADGKGGSAQVDVVVKVRNLNRPPSIAAGPAASPGSGIGGDRISLSVTATDPDDDALSIAWSQLEPVSPAGGFPSGTSGATVEWDAPEIGAPTAFKLQVTVTDGHSPPLTREVSVTLEVPAFERDIQSIFTANCICHSGQFASAGQNLSEGNAFNSIVNVAAIACAPMKRVVPGDPDNSVLVRKISGTTCGLRMPFSDPTFFNSSSTLITRIRSWILAGALNN